MKSSMKFIVESDTQYQDNLEEHNAIRALKEEGLEYIISTTSIRPDIEDIEAFIPIGSIGFVEDHLRTYHNVPYSCPIEVPGFLRDHLYMQREYTIAKVKDLPKQGYGFIKSAKRLKHFSYKGSLEHLNSLLEPEDWCVFSEVIPEESIQAEFRVFVHNGKVKAVKQYDGLPTEVNNALIEMIVTSMNNNFPIKTYSFDLGMFENGVNNRLSTFLIEVHLVSSLGTYGFSDNCLLDMYVQTYEFLKSETHKELLENRDLIWGINVK